MNSQEFRKDGSPFPPEKKLKMEETGEFQLTTPLEKRLDELEQITKIRNTLQEKIEAKPSLEECVAANIDQQEIVVIYGRKIIVRYVSRAEIYPAFGYSIGGNAVVRDDLPPRVKKFVRAHEIYHCLDKAEWGGWVGREIRANIIPGLKDPIGLVATIWATISNIDRIKFYIKKIRYRQ